MNALVSIAQILEPETIPASEVLVPLTPQTVFVPGGVEAILSRVEAEVRATPRDISTAEGREAVKALAYKVARSKTALDEMGKELVADIKKKSGAIDAERRTIRDRLDALKEEVRGPLTAWETAETDRVDGHERALVFIIESARFATPPSAATIRERIEAVAVTCSRAWEEFHERADAAATETLATLNAMREAAEQHERDAAELAELRQQKAAREAADRLAAEAKANADRVAGELAAAAERERERAEQATRDQEAAAARAVEQERARVAAVEASHKAAAEKREANSRHRTKVLLAATGGLTALGIDQETAKAIISAIADGDVPHVSITY